MQAPPPGPIGPGGYPREPGYGQPEKFGGDMAVGIIIIVVNAIFACIGGLAVLAGGVIAGGGTALNEQLRAQGQKELSTQGAQAAGGMVMIVGIIFLIASIAAIIGAVGIIKSAKWGLTLTFVIGLLLVLLSVVPFNPIGLVLGLFQAIYCGLRLFGNVGPRPA
jgi:hypothetical protein